jgi:hypothetical protein
LLQSGAKARSEDDDDSGEIYPEKQKHHTADCAVDAIIQSVDGNTKAIWGIRKGTKGAGSQCEQTFARGELMSMLKE